MLDGVNLAVETGEIVGVRGPSGSGKTTLLRLAAGLERPRSGRVLAAGGDLWPDGARSPRRPRPGWVGALFQDPAGSLDPAWTIERILAEPFRARGRPAVGRDRRRDAVSHALDEVGLGDVDRRTRPGQLSGGQQQRLALARCLLAEPTLILADEPTSALDVTNAAGVMHLVRRTADRGTAVIVVSHDRALLDALADRVLECRDGRLDPVEERP